MVKHMPREGKIVNGGSYHICKDHGPCKLYTGAKTPLYGELFWYNLNQPLLPEKNVPTSLKLLAIGTTF
jgi:hypothetical protein